MTGGSDSGSRARSVERGAPDPAGAQDAGRRQERPSSDRPGLCEESGGAVRRELDVRPDDERNAPSGAAPGGGGARAAAERELEDRVVAAIRTVYDPEIPVNIYDLGLIYNIEVYPLGRVAIRMTLTSPACPVAGTLPPDVEDRVRSVEGVTDVTVDVVWEPPWTMEMMTEEAKLELNLL